MLMITLYAEQKKRHRFIEQSFRLCGRRWGQDVSREQHRNMYTVKGETDHRPRLDAWDKRSDLVLWEDLEGVGGEGGGRGDRDGEDMWTQGYFISMYDRIHYKKKKKLYFLSLVEGENCWARNPEIYPSVKCYHHLILFVENIVKACILVIYFLSLG